MAPSVFVSSTCLDNQERRRCVADAIARAGLEAVGMERFTASQHPTVDEDTREVRAADVYLGILAWRYGTIPEGHAKSYTELEYDAACEKDGMPRLVFYVDESVPLVLDEADPEPGRWDKQKLLDDFKARVKSGEHRAVPFTDDGDLALKVLQALHGWWQEQGHGGSAAIEVEVAEYARLAAAKHETVRLVGFETRVRAPIDLEELYVPLHAAVDPRWRAGDEPGAGRGEWDSELPLTEAFSRAAELGNRRGLVILGHPGSGKTTHLKRLLLWIVRRGPAELDLPDGCVPVYLPLRDLGDTACGLGALIERELASPHLRLDAGFAERLLARGNLVVLLDGLDEVPGGTERDAIARWIEGALEHHPESRFVVTSRYAGYTEDARLDERFLELHLKPLEREEAERFVRNWYRLVETGLAADRAQAEERARVAADELVERLRQPDYRARRVLELTRNPLLLTAICLVHRDRGQLPNRRVKLYEECVDVLLQHWREAKKLPVTVHAESARTVLQPMAYWLHREEGRTQAAAGELEPVLEDALARARWRGTTAQSFLATIRDESGLLTGWSGELFGFLHLGFQEYLAAREIRARHFDGKDAGVLRELAGHFGESWWREVTLLCLALEDPSLFEPLMREVVKQRAFAEHPELVDECLDDAVAVSPEPFARLLRAKPGKTAEHHARQLAALRVLETIAPARVEAMRERLITHPLEAISERFVRVIPGQVTIAADRGGYQLVPIPAGTFLMGSPTDEEGHYDDESPQHEVSVPAFYLGRSPVTNEEYGRYMAENPGVLEPQYWSDRRFNQPRQPVVGVSWDEARAYCAWAGLALPSEAQWEYACRAGTTTRYWSGDSEEDLARVGWYGANSERRLHPVGEKPANPFGLFDVHGNVWEWCADAWSSDYTESQRVHPNAYDKQGAGLRVSRGGSFGFDARFARSACRYYHSPGYRDGWLGFRPARVITG